MTIIDSIVTIQEVVDAQGREINTIVDKSNGNRVFTDDVIEARINQVVRFVYSNAKDLTQASTNTDYVVKFAIIRLSVISLNNLMMERGYLKTWTYVDPYDIEELRKLLGHALDNPSSYVKTVLVGSKETADYYNYFSGFRDWL